MNNAAHAGGFVGGMLAGLLLGHTARGRSAPGIRVAARPTALLTFAAFALSLWTTFGA